MASNLSAAEEGQLLNAISMFEVIVQANPGDVEALDVIKEAYHKLGRTDEVLTTSKRLVRAYEETGRLSSAMSECEAILRVRPEDPDMGATLARINQRVNSLAEPFPAGEAESAPQPRLEQPAPGGGTAPAVAGADDGKDRMRRVFVEGRFVAPGDFDKYWKMALPPGHPSGVCDPFIQVLADKAGLPLDQSLKLLCEHSRRCYIPIERCELEIDWVRGFPRETCQRWCVLPFDRMSKVTLVATANPWNRQAELELDGGKKLRCFWYLASPAELKRVISRVFR